VNVGMKTIDYMGGGRRQVIQLKYIYVYIQGIFISLYLLEYGVPQNETRLTELLCEY
jgi:hypothetical protein